MSSFIVIAVVVSLACIVGYLTQHLTRKDDTPIEEACEEVIKEQTGIDIDLSPSSPEAKKSDRKG